MPQEKLRLRKDIIESRLIDAYHPALVYHLYLGVHLSLQRSWTLAVRNGFSLPAYAFLRGYLPVRLCLLGEAQCLMSP